MFVLTSEQMQRIDAETIDRVCPGLELMERAGQGCAEYILYKHGREKGSKAVIFVGPGNNGGDGLVIARYLLEEGWNCSVHFLKSPEKFTPDSAKNYQRLMDRPVARDLTWFDTSRPDWIKHAEQDLADATIVVDAIFGTGASGEPRGVALEAIQLINDCAVPVVSIDIPSGVDGTSADTPGEAIIATETLTIGAPKLGTLFHPGKEHCADVAVIGIGFPDDIIEKHADPVFLLDIGEASSMLPLRSPSAHKFDVGVLTIVAGSRQYRGAALLAAEAALRGGCGMVYLGVPESISAQIDVALREVITVPLPETAEGTVAVQAVEVLQPYLERSRALALGPGLGRNPDTAEFVRRLVASAEDPVVIDADALAAWNGRSEDLAEVEVPLILTPHSGELARLTGMEIPLDPVGRIDMVRSIAEKLEVTLVHKGAPTIVVDPVDGVWINTSGSSALATGGTGDVLTGFIGSFLAQEADPIEAACIACFIHGRAGDMAARELGKRGVLAGDLLWALGGVMVQLETMAGD